MECDDLKCNACGKSLCDYEDDAVKIEGHYNYDNEAYCIECWDAENG